MNFLRHLNRILCYIPFIWVVGFFSMVLIGIVVLKKIPVYAFDPDPYALSIQWINLVMWYAVFTSLLSIPLNLIVTITLLAERVKFSRSDKIALLFPFLSIGMFFFCKNGLPNLFEWVMD